MIFNSNIKLPQKSIFGFKILTSLQSSLSCYLLLLMGRILNPFFGFDQLQLITGSLFNVILNISIVILTFNLFIKRRQIQIFYFIFLNSFLFVYLPISFHLIFIYSKFLISFLFWRNENFPTKDNFIFLIYKFKSNKSFYFLISSKLKNYS